MNISTGSKIRGVSTNSILIHCIFSLLVNTVFHSCIDRTDAKYHSAIHYFMLLVSFDAIHQVLRVGLLNEADTFSSCPSQVQWRIHSLMESYWSSCRVCWLAWVSCGWALFCWTIMLPSCCRNGSRMGWTIFCCIWCCSMFPPPTPKANEKYKLRHNARE